VPEVPLWITGASMLIIALLPTISETAWTWAAFLGVFGYALIYIIAAVLLIYLRVTRPDLRRPFRCPGYPVTPLLVIVIFGLTLLYSGREINMVGALWALAGVVFYFVAARPLRRRWLAQNNYTEEAK